MAATNERRALVNLSVIASSAAMLAVAWAGITHADRDPGTAVAYPMTTAMAVSPVQPSATPVLQAAPTIGGGQASSSVTPRRVVVVRQSRAS